MTPSALGLIILAAMMHVAWNALAKRSKQQLQFLWLSMCAACLLLSIPAAAQIARTGLDTAALPYAAATCLVHAAYIYSLSRGYRAGDLSLVYPIARGLGVALVALLAWPILGEEPSLLGAIAPMIVVLGIILVSYSTRHPSSAAGAGAGKNIRAAISWAVLTGMLIATYSLIDKLGVKRIAPLPYVVFLGLGTCTLLAPVMLRNRQLLAVEWRASARLIAVAACLNLTSYLLVLHAMRLANTSYVVASRELSVVFSVIIGQLWLGERPDRFRIVGAVTIMAGVLALPFAH